MQVMLDSGLGKAPAAYIDRFCDTLGPIDNEPVDCEGNTRLHEAARQGFPKFAGNPKQCYKHCWFPCWSEHSNHLPAFMIKSTHAVLVLDS